MSNEWHVTLRKSRGTSVGPSTKIRSAFASAQEARMWCLREAESALAKRVKRGEKGWYVDCFIDQGVIMHNKITDVMWHWKERPT